MAHAAQEKFDRTLRSATSRRRVFRIQIVFERFPHRNHRGVALLRIALQRLVQDGRDPLVDTGIGGQANIGRRYLVHDLEEISPLYRPMPGQQLVENQPGSKHIGLCIDALMIDVLGRHIGRRSGEHLGIALLRRFDARGNAEVHHPREAVFIQQDIGRFQVAVNDAQRMSMGNGIKHRLHDGDGADR